MQHRINTMPPLTDNFLETALGVFLDAHRATEKGEACSFTGMGMMRGKFMVKDEEYPQFLDLLHEYLFTQGRRPLNLVEQRRCDNCTPILIDLDFKYPAGRALERQFELSHIYDFIQEYVGNITHFYDLEDHSPLRFFVTLRASPYEDKKSANRSVKDGVHIECPDLVLPSEHQQVLRHRSLERSQLGDAFRNTGYINPEKDIFDEAIVKKNGWFFYGESKPDIPAYHLDAVFVYNPKTGEFENEDVENYEPRQLMELLSIRYNLRSEVPPFKDATQEDWKLRMDYCTGRKPMTPALTAEDAPANDMPMVQLTSSNVYEQFELDKIELAKKLARECLSAERASGYASWIAVGWCLHNIDPSEEMFRVWMDFSQKSPKAGENNEAQLQRDWARGWGRSKDERMYTIRSLHSWAREDNPKKYKKLTNDSFIQFVEAEVDATHTHIARLMKRMYCNNYCAAVDAKKVDWYEFTGVCWKQLPQGIDLRNKMATEVAQVISDTRTTIRNRLTGLGNDERTWEEVRMKKLTKIEQSLYTSGFKDSVMKECVGLFYEEDFTNKLNANPYLLGFNNGVIDLHATKTVGDKKEYTVQFRKAEPTDFITHMAGRSVTDNCEPIDYIEYNPNDPEQKEINEEIDDFMTKVFPRPELRAYMWRKMASCLEGANKEQTYETWIGVGGNGKSKLQTLMTLAMGDYAIQLEPTVLTRKRPESGAANPDIIGLRNKRFIYMGEPDESEPLNTSRMKQFTGEDDVSARGLFADQSKFKITGKIFMMCNKFPAINTTDRGTWRRVRAVPFEAVFVDPDAEEKPDPAKNIHLKDYELDAKLRKWRTLFMSRLVHIYKNDYLSKGIGTVPAIVMQESTKYQETFDSVGKFMNARMRQIKVGGYEADIQHIFRVYKRWYEEVGGGVGKKLSQIELYKRLSTKCGEPADKRTFKQMRLFDDDADIEEYDKSLQESK